jgi:hypothetical protein
MKTFNEGDHVKIETILDNYTKDDQERELVGQTGTAEDVYDSGMILVRMDLAGRGDKHPLYDFVAEQLTLVDAETQVA